ncbi:ABC transporter permease [Neobacillus niacini]|uniref:ABC transporter permease n=1 Tax=Neobacillus niacini TaxID=86668 RepID=UPI003B58B109
MITHRVIEIPKKKRNKFKEFIPIYIMALPGMIYLLINNYMPMGGIIIAFKEINFQQGILNSPWAGFKNFEYLFKTSDAWVITRNTILYNLVFIILGTILAIVVAILLNEITSKFASRFYQSVILIPFLMSMVVVSYLVFAMLSSDTGFINKTILKSMGEEPISWYTSPKYWPYILTIVSLWKSFGFSTVIFLASIVGINKDYYEAAKIDGASKWQQIRSITLPMLKPTIIILTILNIGRIFYSDFGLFYQVPMNSGALFSVTNTIDTYVYRGLMQLGDMSMSAAAGVYQSFVGFSLVMITNYIVKRVSRDDALF